jgi:hypothetical protein
MDMAMNRPWHTEPYENETDNVVEWDKDENSVTNLELLSSRGVTSYYGARANGVTSTRSFFTTNLKNISAKDLQSLENKTNVTKSWKIQKQTPIKKFIESKLGNYTAGAAFYLLMKDEKVDANREIMIMEKGKDTIYGGPNARTLLNLPNQDCKVNPGNHSDYDVYVQSYSDNRNLIQGTKVLYRMDLHK